MVTVNFAFFRSVEIVIHVLFCFSYFTGLNGVKILSLVVVLICAFLGLIVVMFLHNLP